ncbi:hypothetical protein OTSUT76_0497 [Orientia tsutsugamushi str. UT76]|uniref:Uncharacterized protein n=1 Tax=Orientia tsutsugamushi TaxID=784 RepID=A0A2U3R776_ORITS|nr:hypothetical protein OTSUT76_0497 [Orientia tsutsugamushi str. UT76]SPR09074.1 Uncharacterised protein [Orientia tsutsugamushi]
MPLMFIHKYSLLNRVYDIIKSKFLSFVSLNLNIFSALVGTFILFNAACVNLNNVTDIFITLCKF